MTLLRTACCLFALVALAAGDAAGAPAPGDLAELPHWPIGLPLPESVQAAHPDWKPGAKAVIMAYVPPEVKRIRGMVLIIQNTDSKEFGQHAKLREVCAKRELAVVYLRGGIDHPRNGPNPQHQAEVDAVMGALAGKTGIAEFKHAPWIVFGKSASSKWPYLMTWTYPQRTIGGIVYHGEVPVWPPAPWAQIDGNIMWANANGETEWGGTWYKHVRPSLLNYRGQKGWLTCFSIAKGVGHGDYAAGPDTPDFAKPIPGGTTLAQVWDYLSICVDRMVTLRVPASAYPTTAPVALQAVDDSQGYCVDPFAVEALYGVPNLPLVEKDGAFQLAAGDDGPVSGYRVVPPAKDFTPAEGVPVIPVTPGESPKDWLITDSLKFAMKADPMLELPEELRTLAPKPGDTVTIDGKTIAFQKILPKYVAKGGEKEVQGGIALNTGLRPANGKITLLAYTVLDITEPTHVRVQQGFTAATRVQLVLAGVPVKDREVLALSPGKYPLLMVLRMTANWGSIKPHLTLPSADDLAAAKQMQAEADALQAEEARLKAAGLKPPTVLFRKASEVPVAERSRMFWLADREQVQAWADLHNVKAANLVIP